MPLVAFWTNCTCPPEATNLLKATWIWEPSEPGAVAGTSPVPDGAKPASTATCRPASERRKFRKAAAAFLSSDPAGIAKFDTGSDMARTGAPAGAGGRVKPTFSPIFVCRVAASQFPET